MSRVLTNVVSENSRHLNIAPPLIHDLSCLASRLYDMMACCKEKKRNFSEQDTVFKKIDREREIEKLRCLAA